MTKLVNSIHMKVIVNSVKIDKEGEGTIILKAPLTNRKSVLALGEMTEMVLDVLFKEETEVSSF